MKTSKLVCPAEVMELMLTAVCVVDRLGHFVFVNSAFERIFGYTPDEVIGKPMHTLVFPDDREKTLQTVETLMDGVLKPQFENRWIHKDGQIVHVLWSARWSEEHQARIAVAHDITERKEMEERLHHMAGHDQLTKLPNRTLLLDRLQTALAQAHRQQTLLSILFIDIDGFKHVNDNHGHSVGDNLLHKIAQRLRNSVRASDTAGRLGGDEFLVLLNGIHSVDDVVMIAEKIRAELEQPFEQGELRLYLTPSIGIAHFPENGDDAQQLIQHADEAMYRAKNAGGNRVAVY